MLRADHGPTPLELLVVPNLKLIRGKEGQSHDTKYMSHEEQHTRYVIVLTVLTPHP